LASDVCKHAAAAAAAATAAAAVTVNEGIHISAL
jgi:hypothetical protein